MTTVDIEPVAVAPPGSVTTVSNTIAPWQWGNQNTAPPGNTQVRSNQSLWKDSTILWFSNSDYDGVSRVSNLGALKAGDTIRLQHSTDTSIWVTYNVTAPSVASTGYYTVNVALTGSSNTMPANNQLLAVTLSVVVTVQITVGHMLIDLTLQPNITESMGDNLMDLFCEFLQTVTHLVNHAELAGNIGGVIISDSEDILPATVGDILAPI